MRHRYLLVAAAVGFALLVATPAARAQGNQRAVLDEILDLYKTYDVLLLGEQHDGRLSFEFRLALLQHPRFAAVVQDIVIESANSLYQPLLDDFVLKLEEVPAEQLRLVWRNTTMPTGVWDPPIYEAFIRAVRSLNASRPTDRRVRLLAGDPPIDWARITTPEQCLAFLQQRDETAYTVIENESVRKGRKALVIYGGAHLVSTKSTPPAAGGSGPKPQTIGTYLKARYPGRIYSIIPWSARYGSADAFAAVTGIRQTPHLLRLGGSPHANLSAKTLFGFLREAPVGDMMDAIVFFGSMPDEMVSADPEVETDTAYQSELKRRQDLMMRAAQSRQQPVVKK